MAKLWGLVLAILTLAVPVSAEEAPTAPKVKLSFDVRIPMRDGVTLSGNLYQPTGANREPRPAILVITPYTANSWHEKAMFYAERGYPFLVVDNRGRGNSQGDYHPWVADGPDGFDVIAWMVEQPWSNGKVGMMGGSASGANQWATLKEFPPGLKTIVPIASNHPGYDYPNNKNIFDAWLLNWASSVAGRAANGSISKDYDHFSAIARAHYLAGRSFDTLDDAMGMTLPGFDATLAHPTVDTYWKEAVPDAADYRQIDIPILTITGHYDGVQRGALEYYRRHMQHGSADARASHFLVIGPWNHGGTRNPVKSFGGLDVGEASLVDIDQLHLDWFAWTLGDGPRPTFLSDQVLTYTTGTEKWRATPSLDAVTDGARRLFLQGSGDTGLLSEKPRKTSARAYVYDPTDRRYGRSEPIYDANYLRDTYPADNLLGAGLVYETPPLTEDVTIAGRMRARLAIRADVPDTDIEVTLYEVDSSGRSLRLSQDKIRLRYRNSLEKAEPYPIGKTVRVELPDFSFFARRVARGSKLRLVVRAPESIYAQKNYNSGGEVSAETIDDARVAHVEIIQGGDSESFIDLPIARGASEAINETHLGMRLAG